jgi:hypothetical protein
MTTPSNTIEELVGRVEAATGADRKLDHDLYAALICTTPELQAHLRGMDASNSHGYPAYTYSVDEALALAERVLPGLFCYEFGWQASALTEVSHDAQLHFTNGEPPMIETSMADAHTLPLAIVLATLKALSRIKGDHNDED